MSASLFRSGLVPRLTAAALFGALAFGAVLTLEHATPGAGAAPRVATRGDTPVEPAARATLCIESVEPVETWSVWVDGHAVTARSATAQLWIADIALAPAASLLIEAEPADAGRAKNAFRIRVAGTVPTRDQSVWCDRDWSVAVAVGELKTSARPLEAADLP